MTQRQVFPPLSLHLRALACGRGGMVLVEGLELVVPAGTGLLLRGPNGAGKSTLLMTLAGLIPPLGGAVELAGQDGEALAGQDLVHGTTSASGPRARDGAAAPGH